MTIEDKTGSSLKVKLSLFIISTIFSLSLVELGLRLAGEIVLNRTQKEYIPPFDEGNSEDHDHTYEIYAKSRSSQKKVDHSLALCVGDSFTNGGNVQSYDTYPFHLYSNFQKTNENFSVLNFGKCESSTFDSYSRIKEFIQKRKDQNKPIPGKIVILTGSADLFGINFGAVNDRELIPFEVPLLNGVKSLRIYKVYRFFKYEIFRRFALTESLRLPYEQVSEREIEYIKIIQQNSLKVFKETKLDYSHSLNFINKLSVGINSPLSPSLSKEVFPKEQIRGDLYIERLLVYYVGILARKNQHTKAIEYTLDFMKENKDFFWKSKSLKAVKYYFTQALLLQSKYSSVEILKLIEESAPKESKKDYVKMHSMIKNWDEQLQQLDEERMKTWTKIHTLSKQENIKIILQNYPSEYHSANKMINKVAKKFNFPLVDNYSIFKKLIESHGRERFLYDDDHCTPEGYKIMAKNVHRVIKEQMN
ncbi:hypothetical protein A9Q84_19220 [Halobacteriovorax marinus]|uniref:SGNH hydrolase-type esterase domain-containing protein n=1 Tax=Halobacteriovorax marinus TaxID=97084 RepID=A0A1Y5F2E5_9BACT|nr:hypothetical protein A9Q84_19220 [Halobacteriovorax marinus]